MANHEEEDLRMALRMSMQNSPPDPKRSKPRDGPAGAPAEEPSAVKTRRLQRELMAAAAEKRMLVAKKSSPSASPSKVLSGSAGSCSGLAPKVVTKDKELSLEQVNLGKGLSEEDAKQLFSMVFGSEVTKGILAQWSNQGIRFSPDPETSMGLVQHEGGPCGVLAAIQAFVLKYLLFYPAELGKVAPNMHQNTGSGTPSNSQCVATNNFASLTEDAKARVLIRSMGEILFLCGSNKRAVIATLSVIGEETERSEDRLNDEVSELELVIHTLIFFFSPDKNNVITKSLEGLSIESAADLHKVLRVSTYTTQESAFQRLQAVLPAFQSRMGALLFLISALLSRGLDLVQSDRDDPSLPLSLLRLAMPHRKL
ncbi:hypothetical protein ACFXTN_031067 [Malus domestica]